jgi:hypothetical protein
MSSAPASSPPEQVAAIEMVEATVNKNLERLSGRGRTFYLVVNPDWVKVGSVPRSYEFELNWEAQRRGQTLPAPSNRIHGQVDAHYNRLALKALGAAKNPTYPIIERLTYRLLAEDELVEQPWVSSELFRFEHGELFAVEIAAAEPEQ